MFRIGKNVGNVVFGRSLMFENYSFELYKDIRSVGKNDLSEMK